jgi:hypothetical protein
MAIDHMTLAAGSGRLLFQKDNVPPYASRDAETWKHFDIIFLEYCSM